MDAVELDVHEVNAVLVWHEAGIMDLVIEAVQEAVILLPRGTHHLQKTSDQMGAQTVFNRVLGKGVPMRASFRTLDGVYK